MPGEIVEPYRRRAHGDEGQQLRRRMARWAESVLDQVTEARPEMPQGIEDRDADVWEPILAVADAAGGRWPTIVRVAAVTLVTSSKESTPSLGIRLLNDIREVFGTADSMTTESLLNALCSLPESPWLDIGGKQLNDRGLAIRLRTYEIKPKPVRIGALVARGYARADLYDAWQRYLRPPPQEDVTNVTSAMRNNPQ